MATMAGTSTSANTDVQMNGSDAQPNKTLYLHNLNEKVKLDVLKQSLRVLFKQYGQVLDVVAHRNIRMRGQAFVVLDDLEAAKRAHDDVQNFPLYGKPIQIEYARTASDATVKREHTNDEFEQHKQQRLTRKKMSRKDNPLRRKFLAQKEAAKKAVGGVVPTAQQQQAAAAAAQQKRIVQMPDEYMPPNKILFVQNLPDDTTKEQLEQLFRSYPNLVEVRTIPGRKNIAFVEYTDDQSSAVAKDALHNMRLGQGDQALKIKVSFAKLG